MSEEELPAGSIELGHHPEVLVGGDRLRLDNLRPRGRRTFHKDEFLHTRDVEEGRRVRRVDHLVSSERELTQDAVEVALRLRAEIELRLLDQEYEPAQPSC